MRRKCDRQHVQNQHINSLIQWCCRHECTLNECLSVCIVTATKNGVWGFYRNPDTKKQIGSTWHKERLRSSFIHLPGQGHGALNLPKLVFIFWEIEPSTLDRKYCWQLRTTTTTNKNTARICIFCLFKHTSVLESNYGLEWCSWRWWTVRARDSFPQYNGIFTSFFFFFFINIVFQCFLRHIYCNYIKTYI